MNAEYLNAGKLVNFSVTPEDGAPPHTVRTTERTTCGKYIIERVLVYQHYDSTREVAVYVLEGRMQRLAL